MKADFNGYSQRTIELEQKHGKSFKFINEMEKLEMLSNELGLDNNNIKSKTLSAMKNNNHTNLLNNQMSILNEINNSAKREGDPLEIEEKKKALGKLVSSFSNRGYGNNNEESVIDLYSRMTCSIISQQQKSIFYPIKYPNGNTNIEWYLKGKIDGLAKSREGEEILVEIKNRTRCLFGVLKDYEKPQIQCYLKMMNLKHGHLVEHLANKDKNSNQIDTNVIDVYFEQEYWKMIKDKINGFLKFFDYFLENQQLQDALLMNQYNEEVEKHFIRIRDSIML